MSMLNKGNSLPLLVGVYTGTAMGSSVAVPQEDGNEDPGVPLLGIYTKDSILHYRDTCSSMFIAALLIIVRNWPSYSSS